MSTEGYTKCPACLLVVWYATTCCVEEIRFLAQSLGLGIAHAIGLLISLGIGPTDNDLLLLLDEDAAWAEESGDAVLNEVFLDVVFGLDGSRIHLEEILEVGLGDAIVVTKLLTGLGLDKPVGTEAVETAPDQTLGFKCQ